MEAVLRKQNKDYFDFLILSKKRKIVDFRFCEIEDKYLISNDYCDFNILNKNEFMNLLDNTGDNNPFPVRSFDDKIDIYRSLNSYNCYSTALHIFVVGLDCPLKCVYCQVDAGVKRNVSMMSLETANYAIDFALNSPSNYLQIEFQGGEPLSNFDVIKYIVKETNKRNKIFNKEVNFVLITSLFGMTNDKLNFIIDNNIKISISLDGPQSIHNKNRPAVKGNNFDNLMKWIEQLDKNSISYKSNFILTATKYSLEKYDDIVDFYLSIGANSINFRPLSKFGRANENWKEIGYTPEEFGNVYFKVITRIINKSILLNLKVSDYFSQVLSKKIFKKISLNHSEFRSPCGAAIGQMVYDWNGDVYPCDEARMLAVNGDKIFKLGNVYEDTYQDCISNKKVEAMCASSLLQLTPPCKSCVFLPICGICPVYNYYSYGSLHIRDEIDDYNCNIKREMFKAFFAILFGNDKTQSNILKSWANE